MESRRTFLKYGGLAASAAAIGPGMAFGQADKSTGAATAGTVIEHKLAPLPYALNALEPYLDAKTLELHHDRHHAAYVKGLNAAEQALAAARAANDFKLIQHWSRQYAFHGAGHALHTLYWETMAPPNAGGGGRPTGALADQIVRDFGSFDAFKGQFSAASLAVEASGWCALHYRPEEGRLLVLQIENHQKLTPWYATPLLTIDVWEHAYYLGYNNKRDEYIAAWWNVVNWPQVAKNFEGQQRGATPVA